MTGTKVIEAAVARLRAAGCGRGAEPHPRAAGLVLPDGRPAPECLRLWAAFDNRYPLNGGRTAVPIADRDGVLVVQPMDQVLRRVCLESVEDEVDEETLGYLEGLVEGFAVEFGGYGAVLADEHPDPVLWISATGEVSVLWYRHDRFDRRVPFLDLIAEL